MQLSARALRSQRVRLFSFCLLSTVAAAGAHLAGQQPPPLAPGANVNIVRGTGFIDGDPYLQRQNEPSIAVSTRNPCHLLAGANDYRTVDIPDPTPLPNETAPPTTTTPAQAAPAQRDAWLGVFQSTDCGATWRSTLLPGYPQDQSPEGLASPNSGFGAGADPVVRAGTNGLFFYAGLVFDRIAEGESQIFVTRYIDNNNKERGNTIQYVDTSVVATAGPDEFVDKPWVAVDMPRGDLGRIARDDRDDEEEDDEDDKRANGRPGNFCEINGQRFPAGNIYIAWASFQGDGSQLMFARSTDCGRTWQRQALTDSTATNQGAAVAIAPHDGTVYVAWRRFATATHPASVHLAVSRDGGRTFRQTTVASAINVFDQQKLENRRFRTNALPTVAADHRGRVYVAWSERGFAFASGRTDPAKGDARIVLAVSSDRGRTFQPRYPIDDTAKNADGADRKGHQVMPSLTFTAGKLQMIYYDFSDDFSETFEQFVDESDPTPDPAGSRKRHTVDVRGAHALPGLKPVFVPVLITPQGTSPRLSQYRTIIDSDGNLRQVQFNPPNLPMYVTGTTPFIGDYIDVAGLNFAPDGDGWRHNNGARPGDGASGALAALPIYHAVWTDHRDVRPPLDGNWAFYKAPGDPFWKLPASECVPNRAGMRNANIYSSRLTAGLYAGSPGNTKPLGFRKDPKTGKVVIDATTGRPEHLQRGFVVFVQNALLEKKKYLIKIVNQPGRRRGDRASLVRTPQPPFSDADLRTRPFVWAVASVSPVSTISRTVFVTSANEKARVRVDVLEVAPDTPEGIGQFLRDAPAPLADGLRMTVLLNPDPTNPTIVDPGFGNTDVPILAEETHDPVIFDPLITTIPNVTRTIIEIRNPDESNPDESNPDESNSGEEMPDESNPDESNPDESNPDESNPDESNPDESNLALRNTALADELTTASIVDVQWKVQSRANTTTAYRFRPSYTGDRTNKSFQLLVTRRYYVPEVDAKTCQLGVRRTNQVIVNIANFAPRNPDESNPDESNPDESNPDESNPDESNPDESNATFFLAPGESATVTLRIYDTTTKTPPPAPELRLIEQQTAAEVVSFISNTGEDEPPSDAAGPDLVALDPVVSPGNVGPGGKASLTWTLANRGTDPTAAGSSFRTRILLSSDTVPSQDDRELATATFTGSIPADDPDTPAVIEGRVAQTLAFAVPPDATPGTNFIVISTDVLDEVFEADETNNHASAQFGGAFALTFTAQPAAVTEGFTLAAPIRVAVVDGAGAPVTGADVPSVTIAIGANPSTGVLAGTLTRPNVGGVATFDGLSLSAAGVGYTIVAMATGPGGSLVAPAASAPFTVEPDDSPLAVADTFNTPQDVTLAEGVLTNDIDELRSGGPGVPPVGRVLQAVLVGQPTHGVLTTFNANGTFVYSPQAGFNGIDVFTYRLNDGVADGNVTTVRITIGTGAANTPPVPQPDVLTVSEDSLKVAVPVLANDLDPDGNALVVTAVSDPPHGTAAFTATAVSYVPDPEYFGPDSFTYTVSDGQGGVATVTVAVNVTAVNDNPAARNDSFDIDPNSGANSFLVLANDDDGPDEGETLTVVNVATPAHGAVTFSSSQISYTPTAGYSGPDSFGYEISDGHGGTAAALVRVSVGDVANTPPKAANDTATVPEDSVDTRIGVLGNDKDEDGEDVVIVAASDPAHGTVTFTATILRYTPDRDFAGDDSFTYTISDGFGAQATATVTVTVTPIDDNPVAVDDAAITAQDTSVSIDVLANDFDPDGDPLMVVSATQPANGKVVVAADGKSVAYTPAPKFSDTDTFTYTISDGKGGSETATVSVTVIATDCVPLPAGAVMWLTANDTLADAITGRSAEPNGGATFDAGRVGRAFEHDGFSAFYTFDTGNSPLATITVAGWVFPRTFGGVTSIDPIVAKNFTPTGDYALQLNGGRLEFEARPQDGDLAVVTAPAALSLNQWSHVAATYDGIAVKLYVNGVEVGQQPLSGPLSANLTDLYIGTEPGEGLFDGRLDELMIFGRALSAEEISAIYSAGAAGTCPLPVVTVAATDTEAREAGSDTGTFTITRAGDMTSALVVTYTIGGTALNGTDYQAIATTVTIPATQASATVTITPIDDATVEGTETVVLMLVDGVNYDVGAPGTATVTIIDHVQGALTVTPQTLTFADQLVDTTSPRQTVTVTNSGTAPVSLPLNGITTTGDFFVGDNLCGIVTLSPGQSCTFGVGFLPTDVGPRAGEARVASNAPGSPHIVTLSGTGVQRALTVAPTSIDFGEQETGTSSAPRTVIVTSTGTAALTLSGITVTGEFTIVDNLCGSGTLAPDQSCTFGVAFAPTGAGARIGQVNIASNAPGSPHIVTLAGTATDVTPVVSIVATDPTAAEAGAETGTFTFARVGNRRFALSVTYTIGGTAINGNDYQVIASSVTIPAGQASATRTITPLNDPTVEGDETVELRLDDGLDYDLGEQTTATVTIADNATPVVTIEATDPNAAEAGPDTGTFTYTRVGDVTFALTVGYTIGGTAINGNDYQVIASSVTIAAGEASATRTITPVNDALVEGNETVVLTLVDGPHYDLGPQTTATVTIADDETGGTIACGQTLSGTIVAPGEQDEYTFAGTTGEQVLFTAIATSGALVPRAFLIGPTGTTITSTGAIGSASATLPATGTYSIRVGDFALTQSGAYNLSLQFVTPGRCARAIACGQTVIGNLPGDGNTTGNPHAEQDTYTFTANAGEHVVFTAIATSGTLVARAFLYGPDGTLITSTGAIGTADVRLPQTGTYTLLVRDFNLTRGGSYNLNLQFVTPGRCAQGIACGQTLSRALPGDGNAADTPQAEQDTYSFDANAGEHVVFTAIATSGTLFARAFLYGPDGTLITSTGAIGTADVHLAQSGTYTLLVRDFNLTGGGSYNVNLQFTTPGRCATALTCGNAITGTIPSVPDNTTGQPHAEQDTYAFVAKAGQEVVFTAAATSGTLFPRAFLHRPDGTLMTSTGAIGSAKATLSQDGVYTLLVRDFNLTGAGSYSLDYTIVGGCPGTSPELTVVPTLIEFGEQPVGVPSVERSATVTNTGGSAAAIASVTSNNGNFTLLNDSCTGQTLPPGGSCSFGVRFTPAATGEGTGQVSIASNATGSPHLVELRGAGILPKLLSVNPATARQGDSLRVLVHGQSTHFVQDITTADFGTGIVVNRVTVTSPTSADIDITIDPGAESRSRTVTLTTGAEVVSLVGGFTVTGIPEIVNVNPAAAEAGQNVTVVIRGHFTHFTPGVTTVDFGSGIINGTVTVNGPTLLSVPIAIAEGAFLGSRPVTVRTGDEAVVGAFNVLPGTPAVTVINPNAGRPGQVVAVTVLGQFTDWAPGVTRASFGPNISVGDAVEGDLGPVIVTGSGSLIADLIIGAGAPLGPRDVVVQTGAQQLTVAGGFTVTDREVTPPGILTTSPEYASVDVPLNTAVTIEFNEPLDRTSVTNTTFVVSDNITGEVPGVLSVDATGRKVTFQPSRLLAVGRTQSVYVNGIADTAGNLFSPYLSQVLYFTTGFTIDTTGPVLAQTNPFDGDVDVPLNTRIVLQFSDPLDRTTGEAGLGVTIGGARVLGTYTFEDGGRRVTFQPAQPLLQATVYTVSYTAALKNLSGEPLENPGSFSFTTGTGVDAGAPFVSLVIPSQSSTGVGRNVRPRVVFSEPINPITVTRDSVRLVDATTGQIIVAVVALAADRQTVTLTPAMPLAPHTPYSLFIAWYAGVLDVAGNGSFGAITSFTTGGGFDDTSPTVEAVSPVDGAVGVAVNAQIIARLSEPLDPSSVSATAITLDPPVTGSVALAADGMTVTFTAVPSLALATSYSVRISGVRDLVGNVLTPVSSTFTTAADATPDLTAPRLLTMDPAHGASGVPVTTAITLTFSEPLAVTTVDLNSVAMYANLPDIGWVLLAATYQVDASGTVLRVIPATPLPGGVLIQLNVSYHAVITDLAGNGMGASFPQFTTAAAIDTAPPTVVAVTPNDGTTEVGPNATVVLTFSESLNPASVNDQTIALFGGATRLGAGIGRSADNRTVMLSAALPFDTSMTVVVTSGVRDLAGNVLADFTSTFTTRAAADPEKPGTPSIVTQRPGNGATGVPATSRITLIANEPLNPATVPGALNISQNGVLITGAIAVTGQGQAIHFTPDAAFMPGALIQIFLASTAQDVAGNALFSYSGQFTVEPDTTGTAPVLLRASPVYGATFVPRNPVIEFEFNEPLDPTTVSAATVSLYDYTAGTVVPGTLTLRSDGRVIRLVPSPPLRADSPYFTAIRAGLRDLQGSAYPQIHDFYFTTGSAVDDDAPVVKAVGPPAGAAEVGVNALIRVRFTEPVNAITVSAVSIRLSAGDRTLMPASISFTDAANTQVTVTPLEPLPDSALVTITIEGVEDLAGNAVTPRTTTFTTHSRADVDPPQLLRTSVVHGQADVPVNSVFTLEFNEPVDPPTVLDPPQIVLHDHVVGQRAATLEVSPDGRTVTLTPAGPLAVGRPHSLSVCAVQDLAGNSYFYCAFGFVFTTAFAVDTTAPEVMATNPADGTTGAPPNAQVQVRFNEPVQATSLDGVQLLSGGSSVPVTFALSDGNRTVTLTPATLLAANTVHVISIAGVSDASGNTLANMVSSTFTTTAGFDGRAPFVSVVNPPHTATGVGRNVRPRVVFSEPINPITVTRDSVRLVDATTGQIVVAAVALAADRQTVTLTPAMPLAPHTTYSLAIGWYAGVVDIAGNGSFGVITSFTTGGGVDDTPPTMEAVSPVDGAVGVAVNAQIIARLSEPLDPSSVSATTISLDPPVTGNVALAADGVTITFTPPAPYLAPATMYSVRVSGVRDLVGNVRTPASSTFTTAADATPDRTPPTLIAIDPPHGTTGVSVTTPITLTFSEPVAVTTVDLNSVAVYANLPDIGWVLLAATYRADASGTGLTVTPATPLPGGVTVQLNVSYHATITDLAGNGMGASFPQFTTAAAIDTTPPTVVAVTPNDGTTEVGPNATVVLTFSESPNPLTVSDQTIALFAGATRLGTGIARSADNRTVMLSAALPFDTPITVAVTGGVRDLAGNALADFSSRFRTRAAADPEKPGTPSIITQRPGNGATGVPATSSITLFANEPLNPATVPGALYLSQNGVLITGAIAVTGQGQAIHFTPDAPFVRGALVQIFLASTAQDVAGNALFSYSGQFTVEPDTTTTAPVLLRASPAYGATLVPRNPVIEFEFNEPLDPITVSDAAVFLYDYANGTVVPGTLALRNGGRVIRLVPTGLLRAEATYLTAIRAGLRDLQGSAYPHIHDFYFTTGPSEDTTGPVVKAVGPPAGATDVGVNALIRVRFTEPVNAITVSAASIRLSAGDRTLMPASISFTDAANTQVTVTPLEPLPDSAIVTITIDGVEDLAGHAVTPHTATFTTRSRADVDPPQVLRASVVNGQSDVPVNSVFALEFTEPLDPPTVLDPPAIVLYDHVTGRYVNATLEVSPDGRTVTLTPAGPLSVGRLHTLSVCVVQDLAGNSYFYCAFSVSFTTAFAIDTTAPEVMVTNPVDGMTAVPRNAQLQIRFSEPVQPTSLNGVQVLVAGSPVTVIRTLSDANRTLTMTPATLLAPNTAHVITVSGVADTSGNLLASTIISSFDTAGGFDSIAPRVTLVNPPHGATGVGRNVRPRVVFSEPINLITVTGDGVRLVDGTTGQIVLAAVAVAADRQTVTLTPAMPLAPHTVYTLFISWYAGVLDIAGNGSFGAITSFTTGGGLDNTAPTVEAVSPVDGASGVPVNARVVARLSEPLDPSSVNSTAITLDPPATGSVALAADGMTVTFTPAAPYLAPATTYLVRVSGLRDLVETVATPVSSSFTTAADVTPDITAPTLIATDPPHGATGVPVTTAITLTFSEPVIAATLDLNSVAVYANLPDIGWVLLAATYQVNASGTVLTVTPTTPLPGGVLIQLNVSYHATITDLAGNGMGASFPQFTTAAAIDTTPPTVLAVVPADGTTDLGPNATVVLTFSEPLNPATINDSTIALFAGAMRLPGFPARSADNRTVTLSTTLPLGALITVVATSGVRDLAGNALTDFSSTFRTRAAADPEKPGSPSIITQRPGNGATGVPATSSITLFANEPLSPATIPGALYVLQNGVLITGAVAVTGQGQAIHFTPDAAFMPGALVQIFLASTAQDAAGNALFGYSGQFTVEPDPTTTAPVLLRASPVYGATFVPRNPVIEFEFNEPLDPTTVSDATVVLYDYTAGIIVPGTLTLRNDRVIRLVPTAPLRPEATYFTAIRAGLRDLQGSAYPHIHDFYFTTRAAVDELAPVVKAIGPPPGATEVGVNALIRVRFTEPVNPLTVSGATLRVSSGGRDLVPASISFTDAANTQVTLTPLAPLPDSTLVTITIAGVEDLAGNAATSHTTTFTTQSRADVDPPQLLRASVSYGQSDVPVNSVFTLEFTEPIDPQTVLDPPAIVLYDHVAGQYVNALLEVAPDGRTVILTPAGALGVGRAHTLSICAVQDLAGNGYFYCAFSVFFTTAFAADAIPPQVVVTNPGSDMTAPRNAQIQIRFDEPVQPTSLGGIQLLTGGSPLPFTSAVSDGNRTVTLTPSTLLSANTPHLMTVDGVRDAAGNEMGAGVMTTFTTGSGADFVGPSPTAFVPVDGAMDVPTNTSVAVTFDETINPLSAFVSGSVTLRLTNTGEIVVAGVSFSPDFRTVILTPSSPLAPATRYTVTTGFELTDQAGNRPRFGMSSTFTTQ